MCKTANSVPGCRRKFMLELRQTLSSSQRKCVCQMLYGIRVSQNAKLSSIARSLHEQTPLIKTEDRLWRNLKARQWGAELPTRLVVMPGARIQPNTVLSSDLSDVRKEYAKKIEHLAVVRDQ